MLELRQDGVPIMQVAEGGWFKLPNGDHISPAVHGWESGSFTLSHIPNTPTPDPTPEQALEAQRYAMRLSFAQLLIGLVAEAWITEDEGRAWLKKTVPAAVEALIATLPANQRFAALARATDPSYVSRNDPLVLAMAAALGKTEGMLDAFFRTYANV